MKVKICGLTNLSDCKKCIELGADFLGFNFYSKSPRYIEPDVAKEIIAEIKNAVDIVGVFVNEDASRLVRIAKSVDLDFVQIHGDEDIEYIKSLSDLRIIKAFRVDKDSDFEQIRVFDPYVDYFLFDSYSKNFGGTGKELESKMLTKVADLDVFHKSFLAGGLTHENVEKKISLFNLFAVDVASGVEQKSNKRRKSTELLAKFINKAKT